MDNAYYQWIEKNYSTEDLVDGAFYNSQNGQWVIYDLEALQRFMAEAD